MWTKGVWLRRRVWFKAVFREEPGVSRRTLTDAHWGRIADLVSGRAGERGVTGRDNRLFVDAVLWIVRTGAPWRDLPPELGNWNGTVNLSAKDREGWDAAGATRQLRHR